MGYYIDLAKVSIDMYIKKLGDAYLPPSRMILKERISERFGHFKSIGINNIDELIKTLKDKERVNELQKVECLSEEYLTILLRELNSILPKPNRICEFPNISPKTVNELEKLGIKNTRKLYDRIVNNELRAELAEQTGLSNSEILKLSKLTDLSRIKWVGVTFARMLYDIGVDTAEKASRTNPENLHELINKENTDKGYYKGKIGLNDIRIFVNAAKEVPFDIEY